MLSKLDAIMEKYRSLGYYPSAVCHVFNETDTLYHKSFGDVSPDTWFDLASVSKIICTTMLLFAMEEGRLTPEDPVLRHLPSGLPGPVTRQRLEKVTVSQLLTHTSGIVPWFPFYCDGRDFYTVLERVLSATNKEAGMAYSDLNFMLLAQIFTQVTGLSLREGLDHYIKPIVGGEIAYGPIDPSLCAPTCYGNQIEQRMCAERNLTFDGWRPNGIAVRGSCNDGNAHYYWGGASGHAGVFASSTALMRLCQFYLTTDKPFFLRAMEETTHQRGLGFDKTNVFPDGCGHTGFTGTSIWISRKHHIGAVILTNNYMAMGCNLSTAALQDKNVRQAMSYAIDRQTLINIVYNGQAAVSSMVPPSLGHWSLDVNEMDLYKYDVEKAKALMEAAGYSDSNRLTLKVAAGLMDEIRQAAVVIQQQLAEIYIDLEITNLESGEYVDIWGKMDTPEAGFDLMIVHDGAGTDPNRSISFFFGTDAGANVFGFSNERVDELCALGIATPDEAVREEYYNEAQEICIDDCTKLCFASPMSYFVTNVNVEGFAPSAANSSDFRDTYVK